MKINNNWRFGKVIDSDGSLVQLKLNGENEPKWVYRGISILKQDNYSENDLHNINIGSKLLQRLSVDMEFNYEHNFD